MKKRYRNVINAVFGAVWAILPHKLEEIAALLELRQQGITLTKEQIRERIGDPGQAPLHAAAASSKISVLNLFGTIAQRMNMMMEYSGGTSTELFGKHFDQAIDDSNVSAVVIVADTPGGAVPGVEELADKIYNARGSKPIVTVVSPMMASAGYWIGSAAEEIIAIPSASHIGSIGVFNLHAEESQRNKNEGVTYTITRSVAFKAEENPYEELSEAARERIKERVMGTHDKFAEAVARNRGTSVESINDLGGRTFMADEALELGLIDRIDTLENVLSDLGARLASGDQGSNSNARTRLEANCGNEEKFMDPKLKIALIQAGLCSAGASDKDFEAALATAWAAHGEGDLPDDAEQILTTLSSAGLLARAASTLTLNSAQPLLQTVESVTTQQTSQSGATDTGLTAADITGMVQISSLGDGQKLDLIQELVGQADTLSANQVLDRINALAVENNSAAGSSNINVTRDAQDNFAEGARDAILEQTWQRDGRLPDQIFNSQTGAYEDWKPRSVGRNFGMSSPLKIAQQCLMTAGVPAHKVMSLAPMQVAQLMCGANPRQMGLGSVLAASDAAYNVSGMFSNVMLDASNAVLRRSYDDGKSTYQRWMRRGEDIPDFRDKHAVITGELSDPKAVPEDGEFEEATLSDSKEKYRLTVWGQIVSISWQLIVNDRMGAFTDLPVKMGRAMRRKENRLAYAVVKDNAALSDNVALFHSGSHGNVTTGAISTVTNYVNAWSAMDQKMREQKGLDADSAALNIGPDFVVFPPALSAIIMQTLGSTSGDTTNPGLKNIWENGLEPIPEAELGAAAGGSDTAHYLAANAADVDTIEYAMLQGLSAPAIDQEVSFDRLAIRRRIYHAFGVKAIDYRGLQQHTGA